MEKPVIGRCPGCGAENAQLLTPQYQGLVDNGQQLMTCMACQEAVIGKICRQITASTKLDDDAKKAAIAKARAKPQQDATTSSTATTATTATATTSTATQ